MSSVKTHYTDAELVEFKELLDAKLAEANADLELLQSSLTKEGEHSEAPEEGEERLSREDTEILLVRQRKFIRYLEEAQARIRNKTYGVCRVTGQLISKERLRLVPHATLSIAAKRAQDKQPRA